MAKPIITGSPASPRPQQTRAERNAAVIFLQTADLALCVSRLGVLLISAGSDNEDERDREALQIAVQAVSAQMGALADIGAIECGGIPMHGPDPAPHWILPPAFQHVEAELGVQHG